MGKTSRRIATACSAAALLLAQAAMAADTAPRANTSREGTGLSTGTGCDQLSGRDRETCLQNLPGSRKGGMASDDKRERDAARDSASSGSSAQGRSNERAGAGSSASGEVRGPNANSGLNTGSGCDQMTGDERQTCLRNLPAKGGATGR
jgi:hypothetical protein